MANGDDGPSDGSSTIYFLRTIQQHHVQLSAMADQKASILMGATAIIMTIVLRSAPQSGLTAPFAVIALAAFLAALLSILAIIPVTRQTPVNLMFFGGFAALSENEYQSRMTELMRDNAAMHRAMVRDIHQLGGVLYRKKYRLIGWAYRVFLAGLITGFALYLVGDRLPF